MALERTLAGFEHVNRYWDKTRNCIAAKILPGEYYVTTLQNEVIITVLGSCIAVCIRDPCAKIAGMNHFMLPYNPSKSDTNSPERYGLWAMESLINNMIKHGANKQNFEVKVFGGGHVLQHATSINIGDKNIDFVQSFFRTEDITVLASDVGGRYGRKIVFSPPTGIAKVKHITTFKTNTVDVREDAYLSSILSKPSSGEIELFE